MDQSYRFVCEGCGREYFVDEEVKTEIISKGCVFCRVPASSEWFGAEG